MLCNHLQRNKCLVVVNLHLARVIMQSDVPRHEKHLQCTAIEVCVCVCVVVWLLLCTGEVAVCEHGALVRTCKQRYTVHGTL